MQLSKLNSCKHVIHLKRKGEAKNFHIGKAQTNDRKASYSAVRRFLKLKEKLGQLRGIYSVCVPNRPHVRCFPREMCASAQ